MLLYIVYDKNENLLVITLLKKIPCPKTKLNLYDDLISNMCDYLNSRVESVCSTPKIFGAEFENSWRSGQRSHNEFIYHCFYKGRVVEIQTTINF